MDYECWWLDGKEFECQCRTCEFNPWSRVIPWRRKWQPTPITLPGKPHGFSIEKSMGIPWRSLAGYSPSGCERVAQDSAHKQQNVPGTPLTNPSSHSIFLNFSFKSTSKWKSFCKKGKKKDTSVKIENWIKMKCPSCVPLPRWTTFQWIFFSFYLSVFSSS